MEFVWNRHHGLQDSKLEFVLAQSEDEKTSQQVFKSKVYGTISEQKLLEGQNILILKIMVLNFCAVVQVHIFRIEDNGFLVILTINCIYKKCEGISEEKLQRSQTYICKICAIAFQES